VFLDSAEEAYDMSVKKAPAPTERRSALDQFEKAMRALAKRDHEKAGGIFDALIAAHPEERDILERARLYRGLCSRATERRPAWRPRTFEEFLVHGVYLHNAGEPAEALKAFAQAGEMHPRNEHLLYCTAAAAARAGDTPAALKALRGAIQVNGANRAQARIDDDFAPLRESDEFLELLEAESE
jgi:tetratricopeptide (TPR) repeat protein